MILKPANVFLTHTEEGDLLDEAARLSASRMARRIVKKDAKNPGDARRRLTMKGLVLGSPAYMSPEQAMAESPDVRSDVWSLAVLAFEALAGVTPFNAKGPGRDHPPHLQLPSDQAARRDAGGVRGSSRRCSIRLSRPTSASAIRRRSVLRDRSAAALPTPAKRLAADRPALTERSVRRPRTESRRSTESVS